MLKKILTLFFIITSNGVLALSIGDRAPNFSLPNQNNEAKMLNEHLGSWVILYFYPMDDTPGCTTEACNFRDAIDKIIAKKAVVYGVSLDSIESHKKFSDRYKLTFSILSDSSGNVSKSYESLSDFLIWKTANRNTFIIDPEGKIAKIYTGVDPKTHVQVVLRDLIKLQL